MDEKIELEVVEVKAAETAAIEGEIVHHSLWETAETNEPENHVRALIYALWEQHETGAKEAVSYQETMRALAGKTVDDQLILDATKMAAIEIMGNNEVARCQETFGSLASIALDQAVLGSVETAVSSLAANGIARYQEPFGGLVNTVFDQVGFRNVETAVNQIVAGSKEITRLNEAVQSHLTGFDWNINTGYQNLVNGLQGAINTKIIDMIEDFRVPQSILDHASTLQSIFNSESMTAVQAALTRVRDYDSPASVSARWVEFEQELTKPVHIPFEPFIYRSDWPAQPVLWGRSTSDFSPDPPPNGGTCYQQLQISRGNLQQIDSLLTHYFGMSNSPSPCFIVGDENENYWQIYHCEQMDSETRLQVATESEYIGYIYGIDLPIADLEIYARSDAAWQQIEPFILTIKQKMILKGFEFKEQSEIKRGWNAGTEAKLQDLRDLRNRHKHNNQVTITRIAACNLIGIDSKTVKKYALDLWEHWEDWDF